MRTYALRRLALMVPSVFIVATVSFILLRIIPGDSIDAYIEELAEQGALLVDPDALRAKLGLDRPLHLQYLDWWKGVFVGDFGTSIQNNKPVLDQILRRLPATIELALLTLVLSTVWAVAIGVLAAMYPDSPVDYLGRGMAILSSAMPSVWVATMVVILPAIYFGWTPDIQFVAFTDDPLRNLKQFAIPALIGGAFGSASVMRMTRAMVLEVKREDYMTTARSKGLRESVVITRHGLKNAMIPVLTVVGLRVPSIIDGSVLMEAVFGLPGMGRYAVEAIRFQDFPAVQGVVFVFAVFTLVVNLVIDLLYGSLDPRIRYS